MTFDPTDPFGLRRFPFYDEQDVKATAEACPCDACTKETAELEARLHRAMMQGVPPPPQPALSHSPSLSAFLAYWTPERLAQRTAEELSA